MLNSPATLNSPAENRQFSTNRVIMQTTCSSVVAPAPKPGDSQLKFDCVPEQHRKRMVATRITAPLLEELEYMLHNRERHLCKLLPKHLHPCFLVRCAPSPIYSLSQSIFSSTTPQPPISNLGRLFTRFLRGQLPNADLTYEMPQGVSPSSSDISSNSPRFSARRLRNEHHKLVDSGIQARKDLLGTGFQKRSCARGSYIHRRH